MARRNINWQRFLRRDSRYLLLCWDVVSAAVSYSFACRLSLGAEIPPAIRLALWQSIPWVMVGRSLASVALGGVRLSWRHASAVDSFRLLLIGTFGSVFVAMSLLWIAGLQFPAGIIVIDWLLTMAFLGASRYGPRMILESRHRVKQLGKRVLVIGAGDAGAMLVREMLNNTRLGYVPVGFLDDDPRKVGLQIHQLPVLGSCAELAEIACDTLADEVVLAIPSATRQQFERILDHVKASPLPFKTLPSTRDVLEGQAHLRQLRPLVIEDLLGRELTRIDTRPLHKFLGGRRVLITGAAGSIGSELARQIAAFGPEELVTLDRNETDLYYLELALRKAHPGLRLFPVLADIMDRPRMASVLEQHRPEIVFHAAAYKHVPMMEVNASEALKVNVLGTTQVVELLMTYGVEALVFISTDKAVNPLSVMGMTKRLAEKIVLSSNGGALRAVSVRFGNVLGSNGSVLPLFQKQIAEGGPVTVTHPEATRYFMTIAEAVELVLMAGSMGRGGETFVLDMGEPVKILSVAQHLIHLSGLEPDRDIKIEFVGLRPGEKLHEELVGITEELLPTVHEKIRMIPPNGGGSKKIAAFVTSLRHLLQEGNDGAVIQYLREILSELNRDDRVGYSPTPVAVGG